MNGLVWWPDTSYTGEAVSNIQYLKRGPNTLGAMWYFKTGNVWEFDIYGSTWSGIREAATEDEAKAMLIALVAMGG